MKQRIILIILFVFLFLNELCLFGFAKEWKEFRSAHFIIYYKQASNDFLYKIRNYVEDYYQDILEDLGFRRSKFWTWENRARIYLFNSHEDYIEQTGMAEWSAANVDYRNKIINTYPDAPNLFDNVLVHELTHIIFREYVGFGSNIPLWLDEGVATFMEKKKEIYLLERRLRKLNEKGSIFDLKDLAGINDALSFSQDEAAAFYTQSFSLVYFLIKQFGRDAFAKFCYSLRQGRPFEKCLWYAFNTRDLEDLETKWHSYFFD